jgi:hypothetical protein
VNSSLRAKKGWYFLLILALTFELELNPSLQSEFQFESEEWVVIVPILALKLELELNPRYRVNSSLRAKKRWYFLFILALKLELELNPS